MIDLTSHTYEGATVRTSSDSNGNPLFVARDVFECLDIKWSGADSLGFLDDDESVTTGVIDSLKRTQQTILLTESGLYATIFQSRKPEARRFRKWVTSELLPAIRKQGFYALVGWEARRQIERRRLLLRAAELRAEATALESQARGRGARMESIPDGYALVSDWIKSSGIGGGKPVLAMVTSRLRGVPSLSYRASNSGTPRKLWPIAALEQAARDAGLLPALAEGGSPVVTTCDKRVPSEKGGA